MSNPPERIWIEDEFGEGDDDQWTYGTWDVRNYRGYDVEYVRADTVQAQIDAAVAAERERCVRATVLAGERSAGMSSSYVVDAIAAAIRKGDQP
jgi:hypothetical protein